MAQRIRVLTSAYTCEPNRGSEPETKCRWPLVMMPKHNVTVFTRAKKRPVIEAAWNAPAVNFGRSRNFGEPLQLLFVGRVEAWKGVQVALQALAVSVTTARLTLIWANPFTDNFRRLAEKLGLGDQVVFARKKSLTETIGAYRDCCVLLCPSRHDSGGAAVLETMALAVPVIYLDCGGPGLMVDDASGIKVSVGGSRTMHWRRLFAIMIKTMNCGCGMAWPRGSALSRSSAGCDWQREWMRATCLPLKPSPLGGNREDLFVLL